MNNFRGNIGRFFGKINLSTLLVCIIIGLQILILLKLDAGVQGQQYYSIGKYYYEKNAAEYNFLKNEVDHLNCMENARVFYEALWKGHCEDSGEQGYCMLERGTAESIRNNYEKAKSACFENKNSERTSP